jgi:hypothetical protein
MFTVSKALYQPISARGDKMQSSMRMHIPTNLNKSTQRCLFVMLKYTDLAFLDIL